MFDQVFVLTSAPLHKIRRVEFGLLSAEEIKKMSIIEVNSSGT
jgi:hypothetical protein